MLTRLLTGDELSRRLLTPAEPPAMPDDASGHQDLPEPGQGVPGYQRSAWTMLIETSRRWQHVRESYLYPLLKELLEERPELISDIGSAALIRLPGDAPLDVLEALEKAFPKDRQVDLDAGIAAIASRLTQARLKDTHDPAGKADLHSDLAIRWIDAGLYDRALNEADHAVRIYQQLVHEDMATTLPLARALMTVGSVLTQLERREKAHAAAEEAVQVLRRLTSVDPDEAEIADAFLGRALIRLSEARLELVWYEEARAAAAEAVNILQRLTETNRALAVEVLPAALIYLAMACSKMGQYQQAEAPAREAVEITRQLVQTSADPAIYEPNLAFVLNNSVEVLAGLGLFEEARASGDEAAGIYRKLARANPDAFEPELFVPLSNLCGLLTRLGRYGEALVYADEAVAIDRKRALKNRAAAEPHLAFTLTVRGQCLQQLGRREEAKDDLEEAVVIYRRLVPESAFRVQFASALVTLGGALSALGQLEEARVAAERAVEIYRQLARENPAKHEYDLAYALVTLGDVLSDLWLIEETRAASLAAARASLTAARILRKKAAATSDGFELLLSLALVIFSAALAELGQYKEAEPPANEAVEISRRLAPENPAAHEPVLARALLVLGAALAELGRYQEAEAPADEAVEISQRLARENPDDVEPLLAYALLARVSLRISGAVKDYRTAAAEAQDAVRLLTPPERRARFGRIYIKGLSLLADSLDGLGKHEQADLARQRIVN
jgi:tetratricopeptide (TPR) repeat protein